MKSGKVVNNVQRVTKGASSATAASAALLVAAVSILGGCNRDEAHGGAPPERPPAPVTAAVAITKDVPDYIDEIGKTAAREYVVIRPQVAGQIKDIHFKDGADVKQGELLFTIDPRPFEAAVAQAQANVAQQQAVLELAKQEFQRVEGLVQSKAISQQDYDQRKNAVTIAEAQVKAFEAAVRTAALSLEYCTIKSPIDGRVGQRMVDPGNIVKANEQDLVVVQKLDPIYADFTVPERELPRIRKHMAEGTLKVQVTVPGQDVAPGLLMSTSGTKPAPGTQPAPAAATAPATAPSSQPAPDRVGELTFLDTAVQQGLGTVRLRATMPNSDRFFWPGQFVNVRLILQMRKNAVLVPQQALQIGQNGQFVFVVKPDGTAHIRPVQPGQRQGDLVVLEQGVEPGEQVVVTGQNMIMPGAKVAVMQGAAKQ